MCIFLAKKNGGLDAHPGSESMAENVWQALLDGLSLQKV